MYGATETREQEPGEAEWVGPRSGGGDAPLEPQVPRLSPRMDVDTSACLCHFGWSVLTSTFYFLLCLICCYISVVFIFCLSARLFVTSYNTYIFPAKPVFSCMCMICLRLLPS